MPVGNTFSPDGRRGYSVDVFDPATGAIDEVTFGAAPTSVVVIPGN